MNRASHLEARGHGEPIRGPSERGQGGAGREAPRAFPWFPAAFPIPGAREIVHAGSINVAAGGSELVFTFEIPHGWAGVVRYVACGPMKIGAAQGFSITLNGGQETEWSDILSPTSPESGAGVCDAFPVLQLRGGDVLELRAVNRTGAAVTLMLHLWGFAWSLEGVEKYGG